MEISKNPPANAQFTRSASLILASILLLPLSTAILILSYATQVLVPQNALRRRIRRSPRFRPKTILVSGVGTPKGLRIARAFFETGHRVIGADFEPRGVPIHARFSKALSGFYRLRVPTAQSGATLYMRDLVSLVEKEDVDLWISCSEVISAIDDGQARELLEQRTNCQSMQVDAQTATYLDDQDEFIRYTKSLGLVGLASSKYHFSMY